MYLHIGNNKIIRKNSIIGIFDMDSATVSGATKEFLRSCEKRGELVNVKDELPRSFVVCESGKVYISQLSPRTLTKRTLQKMK